MKVACFVYVLNVRVKVQIYDECNSEKFDLTSKFDGRASGNQSLKKKILLYTVTSTAILLQACPD